MPLNDWVSDQYLNPVFIQKLRGQFDAGKPFKHLELKGFLKEEKLILLLKAIAKQKFTAKESDLFRLKQTTDLGNSTDKIIKEFRTLLYSKQFIWYMHELTGIWLRLKPIDIHGSLYEDTDYLLCHDDQLSGRKIAFLFYLSTLHKGQGGTLDLLDSKKGQPTKVTQSIVPKAGTLAFFEVSKRSFHAVSEVTAPVQRIALGGWFHG